MSNNKDNTAAKVVFGLVAFALLVVSGLWAASAVFMAMNGADYAKSSPTMLFQYYSAYGDNPKYEKSFTVAFMVAGFIIVMLPLILLLLPKQKRSLHGDAKFATLPEIRKMGLLNTNDTSLLIGKFQNQWLQYSGKQFLGLFAPTRSGKGVGIVIPNLLNYNQSVVVMDIKGENFDLTSGFRSACGQQVFRFAPFEERTHRYNPLSYISNNPADQVSDILKLAFMLYPDPVSQGANGNFFEAQARALFLGLVLYLKNTKDENGNPLPCTIGEVLRLSGGKGKDLGDYINQDLLGLEAEEEGVEPEPRRDLPQACIDKLAAFANQSDNTRSSILGTFTSPLDLWLNNYIDNATSGDDFDLRQVRREKMSVYVVISPDDLPASRVIINMLFSQLLSENLNTLPEQDNSLQYQCLLLMDEFTAGGAINVIQKGSAYIAGYNLRLLIINQNRSQLVENYSKSGADTLLGNIELLVLYAPAPDPISDAEEYSKLLGYQTVKGVSKSKQNGGRGSSQSQSESDQRRALMLPQELLQMPFSDEVITLRGNKPIYCKKIIYHEDPAFTDRLLPAFDGIPVWDIYFFADSHQCKLANQTGVFRQPENESENIIELGPTEKIKINVDIPEEVAFSEHKPKEKKAKISALERKIAETEATKDFFQGAYSADLFAIFDLQDNCKEIIEKIDNEAEKNGVDIAALKKIEAERLAQESAEIFNAEGIDDDAEAEIMAFEASFSSVEEENLIEANDSSDDDEDNEISMMNADDLPEIDSDDEAAPYEEEFY